ncbi:hypothetical protein [Roseobacter denitrificans]|uniref:Uncharacterized protein n=1 Tax=Roseobacter denitrificans (strain ATCC 33942 / OCh 114) TaxID=375451 RepID=Q16B50_ROSDO|nr:hypothetical protein [Roseobacter denitrificans]ABG30793.1 hypothetical protein RD1_1137 [Roseobacter denitrificans OCh 114]SFG46611.1 hypothetical protein SAMN05443635_1205 [Roseobacter denitrificans OCh 114]
MITLILVAAGSVLALLAGVFFSFSDLVMRGLAKPSQIGLYGLT